MKHHSLLAVIVLSASAAAFSSRLQTPQGECHLSACHAVNDLEERSGWTPIGDFNELDGCNDHVFIQSEPSGEDNAMRACRLVALSGSLLPPLDQDEGLGRRNDASGSATGPARGELCNDTATPTIAQLSVSMVGNGLDWTDTVVFALENASRMVASNFSCGNQWFYVRGQGPVVGIYTGLAIDNLGTAKDVFDAAISVANNSVTGSPEAFFVQRCVPGNPADNTTDTHKNTFGIAVTTNDNLTWAHEAVDGWSSGACLDDQVFAKLKQTDGKSLGTVNSTTIDGVTMWEYSHPPAVLSNPTDPTKHS